MNLKKNCHLTPYIILSDIHFHGGRYYNGLCDCGGLRSIFLKTTFQNLT